MSENYDSESVIDTLEEEIKIYIEEIEEYKLELFYKDTQIRKLENQISHLQKVNEDLENRIAMLEYEML